MNVALQASKLVSEGKFWELLRTVFGQPMEINFFLGSVCSLIVMVIYINSRSVVLATIVSMLSGGVIVGFLPAEVRMAGMLLILVGVAMAGASVYLGRNRRITT